MTLTSNERRAMQNVLYRLYKHGRYKTNVTEFYDELEKSNTLNMDEINNILHYIKAVSTEELYRSLQLEIKARNLKKTKRQVKYNEMTEEQKAKHREVARRYAKEHYTHKKKGKKKL